MPEQFPNRVGLDDVAAPYRAVAVLYNAYLTGLILGVTLDEGKDAAGELIFRVYRQHHHNKFLSSLDKLGLSEKPHAVLAAEYHYLSNSVGGVRVEYMPESDRKAWVRFVHPRWIYQGAAICGVPLAVSRGMLRGWYAHNGVSLRNPRLGFVCTSEDMDGQYGLAGYFYEYDRDLREDERLRFAPGEQPPPFDPAKVSTLDTSTWPAERLAKANRNYAMDPVRLALPILVDMLGRDRAAAIARHCAKLIGLQYYEETARLFGVAGDGAEDFAEYFCGLAEAQGDACDWDAANGEVVIRQTTWRFMKDDPTPSPAVFEAWNGLWEGALLTHNRFLRWQVDARMDLGDDAFVWRIRRRGAPRAF